METNQKPEEGEENKLRRWVANLQLESWQLELLITGFSIFLLASSVEEYKIWSESLAFNKLVTTKSASVIFVVAAGFIIESIPYALQFFLISLLVHLLLRGFWIGIVGLSSVSSNIDFDKLNLKGPFKKHLPGKVRTLDELILYLDNVSSVIFSYTYLVVFSIISIVLVSAFLISLLGLGVFATALIDNNQVAALISVVCMLIAFLFCIAAIIYFLDSILFSSFKKSKWFSSLFYPIHKFFSIISLSFLYRSIYYHLITNYKKKQISVVTIILVTIVFFSFKLESWNAHVYYPEENRSNGFFFQQNQYDDERKNQYIYSASIPSKVVKGQFLELFIRYSPKDNFALDLLCPELKKLKNDPSFMDGFNAGMQTAMDTTISINDLLFDYSDYENKVNEALGCFSELIQVKINDQIIQLDNLFFTRHQNKNEKGIISMIDVSALSSGLNTIEILKYESELNPFGTRPSAEDLTYEPFVKIPFWKEN